MQVMVSRELDMVSNSRDMDSRLNSHHNKVMGKVMASKGMLIGASMDMDNNMDNRHGHR